MLYHLFRLWIQLLIYSVHIHVKRDNSFICSPFSLGKYWPQRKRWWAWHPREPRTPWPPWTQWPPWTWRGECGTWGQGIQVENKKCYFSHIVSPLDGLSSQSIRVEIRWVDTMQQSQLSLSEKWTTIDCSFVKYNILCLLISCILAELCCSDGRWIWWESWRCSDGSDARTYGKDCVRKVVILPWSQKQTLWDVHSISVSTWLSSIRNYKTMEQNNCQIYHWLRIICTSKPSWGCAAEC